MYALYLLLSVISTSRKLCVGGRVEDDKVVKVSREIGGLGFFPSFWLILVAESHRMRLWIDQSFKSFFWVCFCYCPY